MPIWFLLLAAYGMVFGVRYKVPVFAFIANTGKPAEWKTKLQELSECSYCLGFDAGIALWCLESIFSGVWQLSLGVVLAFSSAAFCYVVDAVVIWLEQQNTREPPMDM